MSFEADLAALLDAKLAPLAAKVAGLSREVEMLRRALPPMLVPLKVAAKHMGVSMKTARRRAESGAWPRRRDGRRILVDLAALRPLTDDEVEVEVQRLEVVRPSK